MDVAELLGRPALPGEEIYRDGNVLGMFCPINATQWEGHCAAAPELRGREAGKRFRQLLKQFWHDHPSAQRIIGLIAPDHRAAQVNAIRLGMVRNDRIILPWADGIERETIIYSMERPNHG